MLSWDPHDADHPNFLMFAIWDQRARSGFRTGLGRIHSRSDDDAPHVIRADTLDQLAAVHR